MSRWEFDGFDEAVEAADCEGVVAGLWPAALSGTYNDHTNSTVSKNLARILPPNEMQRTFEKYAASSLGQNARHVP
ncbi:MAG: hypothetical protein WB994_10900 [Candidatus Acidiferrum sp.]